ncbi:Hypothetical predicted protein [Cloeon dipterum]|uniref:Frizzled-4 n=1 Tax=Cloeon dipterum TaxID=197152 RepID=A0A8S1C7T8_9INSE|nr:Hypothetical predicted protein [Cloeon dipterum]
MGPLAALLLLLLGAPAARAYMATGIFEPAQRTCEPIRVNLCDKIGYNVTGFPNLVGHELQSDAETTLKTFAPLIKFGCSARLPFFLCSVYVPMCTEKVAEPIGPCRKLCESVKSRCQPVLTGVGLPWPTALQCHKFPKENNHQQMCMEGPNDPDGDADVSEEITTLPPPTTKQQILPNTPPGCGHLTPREAYVYINRTVPYCAVRCEAEVLFAKHDRRLAEVWLSIWAGLCFVSTLATVLTFLVDNSRFRYPERPAMFLALCYNLASVGWGVRAAAGRTAVACQTLPHPSTAGYLSVSVLLSHDGLANANCAVVFLLLYYFGMAALVWWVILCMSWFLCAARRVSHEVLVRYSSSSHLIAWGVPAAQTVAVLAFRFVDADELTGVCYVGSQNSRALQLCVLLPHCVYLFAGVFFLIVGMWTMPKSKAVGARPATVYVPNGGRGRLQAAEGRDPAQQEALLVRVGVLCFLCAVPQLCVVASLIYEVLHRDEWLKKTAMPSLWVFMVRLFMLLAAGVASIIWVWSARTPKRWHAFLQQLTRTPRKVEQHQQHAVPLKQLSKKGGDPSARYLIAIQQQTQIVHQQPLLVAGTQSSVVTPSIAASSQAQASGQSGPGKFHHTHTHFHHHHHHPRRHKSREGPPSLINCPSNIDKIRKMELPRGLMLFSLVLSVASGPVPQADVTILARMAEDKQICSFPPREMLVDKSKNGILRSCRMDLEEDLKNSSQTLEFAADNPTYLLCMGIYDLSIHVCQSKISSEALPNTPEAFNKLFTDDIRAENFCTDIANIEPVAASSNTTARWVTILSQNLATEAECTRICKPKSNHTNPLCNIIAWGRNILKKRESSNPVEKAPSTALSDEGLMQNGEPKEESAEPPTKSAETSPKSASPASTSSKTSAATSKSAMSSSAAGVAVGKTPSASPKIAGAAANATSAQSVSATATKDLITQASASQPTAEKTTSTTTTGKDTGNGASKTTSDFNDEDEEGYYPGDEYNKYKPVGDTEIPNDKGKNEDNAQLEGLMNPREGNVDDQSNFPSYFLTLVIICVVGYLVFHNKQKVCNFHPLSYLFLRKKIRN